MTVTCATVRRAFGDGVCCCGACHDEFEDGWGNLCGDGENFDVCCKVADWLEDIGVDPYATVTHPALLKALEEEANEPV